MNKNTVLKIVSILDLCSEIFQYPINEISLKVQTLGKLTNKEELTNFSFCLQELEFDYIKLFSVNSTSNKTVPLASWWLDGQMMGQSFVSINEFYKQCGFVVDLELINLPQDHISLMCAFVANLLEDEEYEQALVFINRYFKWLDDFEIALKQNSFINLYCQVVGILKEQLSLIKNFNSDKEII